MQIVYCPSLNKSETAQSRLFAFGLHFGHLVFDPVGECSGDSSVSIERQRRSREVDQRTMRRRNRHLILFQGRSTFTWQLKVEWSSRRLHPERERLAYSSVSLIDRDETIIIVVIFEKTNGFAQTMYTLRIDLLITHLALVSYRRCFIESIVSKQRSYTDASLLRREERACMPKHLHSLWPVLLTQHCLTEYFYAVSFSFHSRLSLTTRRDSFDVYNVCVMRGEYARSIIGPMGKKWVSIQKKNELSDH